VAEERRRHIQGDAPEVDISIVTGFERRQRLSIDFLDRITGLEIRDVEMGATELRLTFDNQDLKLWGEGEPLRETNPLMPEQVLAVRIGYTQVGVWSREFFFRVKSIRGFHTLQLRGLDDDLIRMDETHRAGCYRPRGRGGTITRAHVAVAIADRNQLEVDVKHGIVNTFGRFEDIRQSGSDAKMLTKMAREVGFIWWVELRNFDRYLYFKPRPFYNVPVASGRYVVGVDDEIIEDMRIENDISLIPKTYLSRALDPFTGLLKSKKASNRDTIREVMGNLTPLDNGVRRFFFPPDDAREAEIQFTPKISNAIGGTAEVLAKAVDGVYKEIEKNLARVSLRVRGNPELAARGTIDLFGLGHLSGRYYIEEVRHEIREGQFYETELQLLKNAFEGSNVDAEFIKHLEDVGQSPIEKKELPFEPGVGMKTIKRGRSPDAEVVRVPIKNVTADRGTEAGADPEQLRRGIQPVFRRLDD